MSSPNVQVLLVEEQDHQRHFGGLPSLEDLHEQLSQITGLTTVKVSARGNSSAMATLPTHDPRESERLKRVIQQKLDGWTVVEPQQYSLPQTF